MEDGAHLQKKKEWSVLIVAEGDEDNCEIKEENDGPVKAKTITTGISLNSVVGIDNPRTMKL